MTVGWVALVPMFIGIRQWSRWPSEGVWVAWASTLARVSAEMEGGCRAILLGMDNTGKNTCPCHPPALLLRQCSQRSGAKLYTWVAPGALLVRAVGDGSLTSQ